MRVRPLAHCEKSAKGSPGIGLSPGNQGPRSCVRPLARSGKSAKGPTRLNILQLNLDGLSTKKLELKNVLSKHNIHVALLQETKLGKDPEDAKITGYTEYLCECSGCQGVMTLLRNDIEGDVFNHTLEDIDVQTAEIEISKTKYNIHNVYCPPGSRGDLPFDNSNYNRTIIAGDFNAHAPSLGYQDYNPRGREVEELCTSSNLFVTQDEEKAPTLLHKRHKTLSRPDLSLVSADILDKTTVSVLNDMGSDHRPLVISIERFCEKPKKRTTLWNFQKADWRTYKNLTNEEMGKIKTDDPIEDVYKSLCSAILGAAKKTIPRGNRKKYSPYWTDELETAVKDRQEARKKVEKNPNDENKTAY
ncbi:MAG: hypothetical protein MJA29_01550, partial [Candidatus Omnitrophica bacterium]|nr:hypothetical protein [Candidatus Omnitrophota bacterium]